LEAYVDDLGHYLELDKITVETHLRSIARFLTSIAGQGIDTSEPIWRSVARLLIYSIDYD
jgi:hypothetical protein